MPLIPIVPLVVGGVALGGFIASAFSKAKTKNEQKIENEIKNNIENEIKNIHKHTSEFISKSLNETIKAMSQQISTDTSVTQDIEMEDISVDLDGDGNKITVGKQKSTILEEITIVINVIENDKFVETLENKMNEEMKSSNTLENELKKSLENISKQLAESKVKGLFPLGQAESENIMNQIYKIQTDIKNRIENINETKNVVKNITKQHFEDSKETIIKSLNKIKQSIKLKRVRIKAGGNDNTLEMGVQESYIDSVKKILITTDITKNFMKGVGIDVKQMTLQENKSENKLDTNVSSNVDQTGKSATENSLLTGLIVVLVIAVIAFYVLYETGVIQMGGSRNRFNIDYKTWIMAGFALVFLVCICNTWNSNDNVISTNKYKITLKDKNKNSYLTSTSLII